MFPDASQGPEQQLPAEVRPLLLPRRRPRLRAAGLPGVWLPSTDRRPGAERPRPQLLLGALSQPRGGRVRAGGSGSRLVCSQMTESCRSLIRCLVFQELSLLLAERENARVVLATDPDADRLAVAEKSDGYVCSKALQS